MPHGHPTSIFCIIATEFCERFSFCGLRTILSLYLRNILCLHENAATVVYHIFIMMCYTMPLMGAILADNFIGRYRVILYFSIIYFVGTVLLCCSAIPPLMLPPTSMSMIGLALIATGTGGIKPCVAAFGGDQFRLPEDNNRLQKFFSTFYCIVNLGGFMGMVVTPALRRGVMCFGDDACYALGFGFPAILVLISIVIFVMGKPWYKIKKPRDNVTLKFVACAWRSTLQVPTHHQTGIILLNTLACSVEIAVSGEGLVRIERGGTAVVTPLPRRTYAVVATCPKNCAGRIMKRRCIKIKLRTVAGMFMPVIIGQNSDDQLSFYFMDPGSFTKSLTGKPKLKVVYIGDTGPNKNVSIEVETDKRLCDVYFVSDAPVDHIGESAYMCVQPGKFRWRATSAGGEVSGSGEGYLRAGGVYVLCLRERLGRLDMAVLHAPNPPNELNLAWIVPQYLLVSMAEIMFAVSGLEFSFTQAPKSMKTITIAAWYMSVAIGNLIVILVAQAKIFESRMISVHSASTSTQPYNYVSRESSEASCLVHMERARTSAWPTYAVVHVGTPSTTDKMATTLAKD